MITQAGGGAQPTAALYQPLIRCHASWIKGGVCPHQYLNLCPHLLCLPSPIHRQTHLNGAAQPPCGFLDFRRIPARGDSLVDESPRCCRDPFVSPGLLHPRFRNGPTSYPPLSALLVVGGLVSSVPRGNACAPSGRCCAGNPEPSNGLSCA